MTGNRYNFEDVDGGNIVDQSNLVDGKPIFYLEELSDIVIDGSSNAGTLYCYDCRNITIKDLVLKNNKYGIYLSGIEESYLYNITSSENYDGVHFTNSDENMVTDCSISNNALSGLYLTESEKNLINNNHILANGIGVYFDDSEENTLSSNLISNNSVGIEQVLSVNNKIKENRIIKSSNYGMFLYHSDISVIVENEFSMNEQGIVLRYSNDNILTENNISKSLSGITLLDSSNNNTVFDNYLYDNVACIIGEKENNVFNNSFENIVVGKILLFIEPFYLVVLILIAFAVIRRTR
jgi:parallel beta-helix repeat protein